MVHAYQHSNLAVSNPSIPMDQNLLRQIFDVMPEPAFVHDANYRLLLVNNAYLTIAGITDVVALGKYYWDVFPIHNGPLLSGSRPANGKASLNTREEFAFGGKVYLSLGYSLESNESKKINSFHVFVDISEQKEALLKLALESEKLNKALDGIVAAMSKAMELRDPYTAGHEIRVAKIACAIAGVMGWEEQKIKGLRMAALMHDIGKIAIPLEILTKPSKLSIFEMKIMEEHPEDGYQLLKNVDFPWPLADIVRQHHERMDGSGYPLGIKGDGILSEARILAIADTIEAMSSHRPYRPAIGLFDALAEIKLGAGKKYDPYFSIATLELFEGKSTIEEITDD